jgi:hypothetical protein
MPKARFPHITCGPIQMRSLMPAHLLAIRLTLHPMAARADNRRPGPAEESPLHEGRSYWAASCQAGVGQMPTPDTTRSRLSCCS